MAPGTRAVGAIYRAICPYATCKTFRLQNRLLDKWLKNRWLRRHTRMHSIHLPRKDGTMLRLCIVQPRHPAPSLRTGLLWIHGGGYAIGLPEQDFLFAELFARDGGCTLVMPDYRRSVDAPYPAALEDCCAALDYLVHHAQELGVRTDQIFVGGESAGGGLCAALCLYARDHSLPAIAFQMPLYPMLDDRMLTASMQDNDAPAWNTRSNEAAWQLYLNDLSPVPVYAAPARAQTLRGLPPAFSYVGTLDPFHDEILHYFDALRAFQIQSIVQEYPGCYHGFDILCYPSRVAREARRALLHAFRSAQKTCFCPQEARGPVKPDAQDSTSTA